jgi:hypothetical protein
MGTRLEQFTILGAKKTNAFKADRKPSLIDALFFFIGTQSTLLPIQFAAPQ